MQREGVLGHHRLSLPLGVAVVITEVSVLGSVGRVSVHDPVGALQKPGEVSRLFF